LLTVYDIMTYEAASYDYWSAFLDPLGLVLKA